MDKGYNVRWQPDLVNTKESVLPVCDEPYYTNKGKQQKGEEIGRFAELCIIVLKHSMCYH